MLSTAERHWRVPVGRSYGARVEGIATRSAVPPAAPPAVPPGDREPLLRLARAAIAAAIRGGAPPTPAPAELPPVAQVRAAVFVTIREEGELRGCMGILDPERPLWENLVEAAGLAARGDPRFAPILAQEERRLSVELSLLGPSVPLADPRDLVPGRDGVIVERGGRRALLLPQVAPENGWDGPTFLAAVCRKAGLPAEAWRDRETRLLVFGAEVFGDD
jgi:AmmeMemoRadiSam system protein A